MISTCRSVGATLFFACRGEIELAHRHRLHIKDKAKEKYLSHKARRNGRTGRDIALLHCTTLYPSLCLHDLIPHIFQLFEHLPRRALQLFCHSPLLGSRHLRAQLVCFDSTYGGQPNSVCACACVCMCVCVWQERSQQQASAGTASVIRDKAAHREIVPLQRLCACVSAQERAATPVSGVARHNSMVGK